MAQYSQDYYFIKIDMAGYLTEHSTATYRELMRDCICEQLKEDFNADCEYTEVVSTNQNYPTIQIPWYDGSVTNMPILVLRKNATDTVSNASGSFSIQFHTGAMGSASYDLVDYYGTKTGGNTSLSINPFQNKFIVGAIRESDMMHIGFYVEGTSSSSAQVTSVIMGTIMTKMKERGTDTDKHAIISPYTYTDMYRNYVRVAIEDEGTFMQWYASNFAMAGGSESIKSGIALISPIDIGKYYCENLYVYPRTCSSLRGDWDTDTSFYDTTPEDAWYEEAFVVDGVPWDVKRYSSRGFSYGFSICKKHVLEG